MKKKLKAYIAPIRAVAGLYAVMEAVGITCPIKFLTGISCMGCGMSRAWMAVLRLDIKKAFYYHPLFFTPPLFLIITELKKHINKKVYKLFIFTMVFLYATIYVIRLMDGTNDIVVFQPENNIVFRILRLIL